MTLLCCSTLSPFTITYEKKSPYRVEALYELYQESPDCILTEHVVKERSFFIKMMRNYTEQLSKDIEAQNYTVAKKTGKGMLFLALAAGSTFVGNRILKEACNCEDARKLKKYGDIKSEDRVLEVGLYIWSNVLSGVGFVFAWKGGGEFGEAISYKKNLASRYEIGKKILAQLEQIEEKVS